MTVAQFPEAFEFLFQPARYKCAYGGRGAGKSQSFARALLIQGAEKRLRILCLREFQKSIADSVHALLSDQVAALGLSDFYSIQNTTIVGRNGTEFIFAGLRHNAANIKSTEKIDRAWVEEAQVVSQASLDLLCPSVRAENSELWFSYNPVLDTDPVHKMFALNPPPNAIVRKINWDSNPWFPEVLRIEKDHLKQKDPFPEKYRERHQNNVELSGPGGAAIQVTFVQPQKSE